MCFRQGTKETSLRAGDEAGGIEDRFRYFFRNKHIVKDLV